MIGDDDIYMKAPPGFDGQMDSLFFRNMSPYIIFAAIILSVYLFFKLIFHAFQHKLQNSLVVFFCKKLIGMFEWAGFILIVLGAYTGLSLNCYLQL